MSNGGMEGGVHELRDASKVAEASSGRRTPRRSRIGARRHASRRTWVASLDGCLLKRRLEGGKHARSRIEELGRMSCNVRTAAGGADLPP